MHNTSRAYRKLMSKGRASLRAKSHHTTTQANSSAVDRKSTTFQADLKYAKLEPCTAQACQVQHLSGMRLLQVLWNVWHSMSRGLSSGTRTETCSNFQPPVRKDSAVYRAEACQKAAAQNEVMYHRCHKSLNLRVPNSNDQGIKQRGRSNQLASHHKIEAGPRQVGVLGVLPGNHPYRTVQSFVEQRHIRKQQNSHHKSEAGPGQVGV